MRIDVQTKFNPGDTVFYIDGKTVLEGTVAFFKYSVMQYFGDKEPAIKEQYDICPKNWDAGKFRYNIDTWVRMEKNELYYSERQANEAISQLEL